MGYSYDRRAVEQKDKFNSLFDLQMYLYDQGDWRKAKGYNRKSPAFIKRFGGTWMQLSWYDSSFSFQVFLHPTIAPKNINYKDAVTWKAWREATSHEFDLRQTTLSAMERRAAELAKVHKTFAKRQPKDTSGWRYKPRADRYTYDKESLTGKEAYRAWLKDAQWYILEQINESHKYGFDATSRLLILGVTTEYELEGMSYREMGRAISRLLNAMAKKGLIVKGGERHNPSWFKE